VNYLKIISLVLCLNSCQLFDSNERKLSSEEIGGYIDKGYKIYATKSDPLCFTKSLAYFDTALDLAIQNKDTMQMARAYFGKGSVYDAWNKDRNKTIEYFTKSIQTIERVATHPKTIVKKIYTNHVLAHAYEKNGDSAMAVQTILRTLKEANEIHDTLQDKLEFIPQLALIATEVNNYHLADSILKHCCHKISIANNPGSYNYLDNFYLTKAKIDINYLGKKNSPFLDSFYLAYTRAKTPIDSLEMIEQIYRLYSKSENKEMEYKTMKDYLTLDKRLNSVNNLIEAQQNLNQIENKLRLSENESLKKTRWIYVISIFALFSILGGSGYAYYRQTLDKKRLTDSLLKNEKLRLGLEQKNQMNLLLNKEIHHRIKNNLQFINSLLDMQMSSSDNKEVRDQLKKAQLRIKSVSTIYDEMRKENQINLKIGIQQFIHAISQNFKGFNNYQWICNIQEIVIDPNYAIPLFVILNELITNTIKHGKTNTDSTAYIDISSKNDCIFLQYKDTNEKLKVSEIKLGLGAEIIELLVLQLNGKMSRNENFEYQFEYPYTKSGEL
jgi:two-component sensor histidine kinase